MNVRGGAIAEGDVVAVCINLFSELVLGRYQLPLPPPSDSAFARLAHSIIDEHKRGLATLPGGHRGDAAQYYLLLEAERAVLAIGHAMAYAAARDSGTVPGPLLAIYEAGVVREYSVWFSEAEGVSYAEQRRRETDALRAALPHLRQYAEDLGVKQYVRASIVDDESWSASVAEMTSYSSSTVSTGSSVASGGGGTRAFGRSAADTLATVGIRAGTAKL